MKRWMLGFSFMILLMGCGSDGGADKLYFVQRDGFGNSQEMIVEQEEVITEVEKLLEQLEWQEMEGETKETIYSFYTEKDGNKKDTYTLWRDAEENKVKLFSEQKGAYANLSQQELRTLQEVRGIGEENYYKDQMGDWGE